MLFSEKEKESPAPEPQPEPVEEIQAVTAETVAAEPEPVPEIQANEESQDQSAQILEDVETEALVILYPISIEIRVEKTNFIKSILSN